MNIAESVETMGVSGTAVQLVRVLAVALEGVDRSRPVVMGESVQQAILDLSDEIEGLMAGEEDEEVFEAVFKAAAEGVVA